MFVSMIFCWVMESPIRFIQLKTGEEIIVHGELQMDRDLVLVRDMVGEFYCFHKDQIAFIQNRKPREVFLGPIKPKEKAIFYVDTKPKKEKIKITNELLESYAKTHPFVTNEQVSSDLKLIDSKAEHDMLAQKKENQAAQKKAKPLLAKLEKLQKKIDDLKKTLIHTIDADLKAELLIEFDQLRVEKQKLLGKLKKIQKEARKRGAKSRFQIPIE